VSTEDSSFVVALHLICRTQEQQVQALTQQRRAIPDMAAHQAEDRAAIRELRRRAAGNRTGGEAGAGPEGPLAQWVAAFLVGHAPPSPADGGGALHCTWLTDGRPLIIHGAGGRLAITQESQR